MFTIVFPFLKVSSRPMRKISSQALMLHDVSSPSHNDKTMVEKQPSSCLRISLASDSVPNISDKLFWELYGLKERKANLFTRMLQGSQEGDNLFPCIKVFHILLPTSGCEQWGFWPEGWSHTCPPHFLVRMLGRPMRSCL